MRWFFIFCGGLFLGLLPLACSNNNSNPTSPQAATSTPTLTLTPAPTNTPCNWPSHTCTPTATDTSTPTFTPTNTPIVDVTFSVYSPALYVYTYSTSGTGGPSVNAPITITAGHAAVWDSSNNTAHILYLDNTSSCLVTGQASGFPMTMTFSAGTYHFHCGFHGGCTSGDATCPNMTCSGMAATLVAQ